MPTSKSTKRAKPAAKPTAKRASATVSGARDVDARIAACPPWQAALLTQARGLIRAAVPDVVEEVKWRKPSNGLLGVATWSHAGLICTGEPYKAYVKLTFAHGAALPDPAKVFNGNDNGATRRSIDLREGSRLDETAFKALVRAAATFNAS